MGGICTKLPVLRLAFHLQSQGMGGICSKLQRLRLESLLPEPSGGRHGRHLHQTSGPVTCFSPEAAGYGRYLSETATFVTYKLIAGAFRRQVWAAFAPNFRSCDLLSTWSRKVWAVFAQNCGASDLKGLLAEPSGTDHGRHSLQTSNPATCFSPEAAGYGR